MLANCVKLLLDLNTILFDWSSIGISREGFHMLRMIAIICNATAQILLKDGDSIICERENKAYRYMDNEIRLYPTIRIANSWNPDWNEAITIDCKFHKSMNVQVIKKGWVYKKSILWKSKYSTIVDLEGSYFMNLFSDRMDGNPSVIIPLNDKVQVDVLNHTNNMLEKIYPFKLTCQAQTYLLATKSLKEREEFVIAIRNITNTNANKHATSVLVNRDSAARLSDVKLNEPVENIEYFMNQFYQSSKIDVREPWDQEYQVARSHFLNEMSNESLTSLHQLKFKFRLSLEHFGKLLIDRLFNNPIPKNSENGWLLGQLFFYLAVDYQNSDPQNVNKSHQRINVELSSTGLFSSTSTAINSALMGSVEYKGFKIVGYAILPLNKNIHSQTNYDDVFVNTFNNALEELHLKPLAKPAEDYPDLEAFDAANNKSPYVVNLNCILPKLKHNTHTYTARPEFLLKSTQKGDLNRQLLDTHLPEFVSLLDTLILKPLDGQHLSDLMHNYGINVCFLGQIANKTRIPFIRDLCCIEMTSRAFKCLLNEKIRKQIIQYYSMGASSVDEEISKSVVNFMNLLVIHSKESLKFWRDTLLPLVLVKYNFEVTENDIMSLPRTSLFFSVQCKTGAIFQAHAFMSVLENQVLVVPDFKEFQPMSQLSREYFEILINNFHFTSEHIPNHSTVKFLKKSNRLARDYIIKAENELRLERPGLAIKFINLALALSQETSSTWAIATALHSLCNLLIKDTLTVTTPVPSLVASCLQIIECHVGYASPATVKILDILSECCIVSNHDFLLAEQLQSQKLELIKKFIGPSMLTSEQLTRCALLHLLLKQPKEAICLFEEAISMLRSNLGFQIHQHTIDESSSTNLFWLAESYRDIGDVDAALKYSKEAKDFQDKWSNGEMSVNSVELSSQFAFLVLRKCSFKMGVLEEIVVPNVKKLYLSTLGMLDKVFKFVRSNKQVPYVYPPYTPYLISKSMTYGQVETMPKRQQILFQLAKIILQLKIVITTNEKDTFKKAREVETNANLYKHVIQQIVQLGPAQYIDDLLTRYKCGEKVLPHLNVCIKLVEDPEIDQ